MHYKNCIPASLLLLLGSLAFAAVPPGAEPGCFSGDCENGRGTLIEETDRGLTIYRGTFKNGEYDGFGRLSYEEENAVYKGDWKNGVREGRGTYWDSENNVYIGQWQGGKRNGEGVQAFKVENWREDAYSESWLEDNTENYSGGFKNDVFYGEGTYRWEDGTQYVGGWAANQQHGEGYFDYGNGRISRRRYEFGERVFEVGL